MSINMDEMAASGQVPEQAAVRGWGRETMETLAIVGVLVGYLVLMRLVLPRLGVATCSGGGCTDFYPTMTRFEASCPDQTLEKPGK